MYLRTFSGAIKSHISNFASQKELTIWSVKITNSEILRGEQVFSTGLTAEHQIAPCLILKVTDIPDSIIDYTISWSGSKIHLGTIEARDLFNTLGNNAGQTSIIKTSQLTFNSDGEQSLTLLACGNMQIQGHLKIMRGEDILFEDYLNVTLP